METKRRLAAILFADIVDYTNLSHLNETKALASRKWVNNIVRERGLMRGGRVVKSLGDGSLLEFSSAVEAVSCAIEIQEQIQLGMGFDVPGEGVKVRIGIHVGDVVEEDGDVLGDAVNIASRVQGTALPGGICISREVYTHIRPILRLRCKKIPTTEKDRLPSSVEVLAIDEKDGSTSMSLQAAKRNQSNWKLPALIGTAVIALGALAFGMGWIQLPNSKKAANIANAESSNPATLNPNQVLGVTQETKVVVEDIPFETKRTEDANLAPGETKVMVQGVNGKREITYQVLMKDGKELSREKKEEKVVVPPTEEVIAVASSTAITSGPASLPRVSADRVVVPSERTKTQDVVVPFRVRQVVDDQLPAGERRIRQRGLNGMKRVTVRVTISDGNEVNRKVLSSQIVREPVDQIVAVGRKREATVNNPPQQATPDHPAWFCPECGVRWPGSRSTCPNDGTKRPAN